MSEAICGRCGQRFTYTGHGRRYYCSEECKRDSKAEAEKRKREARKSLKRAELLQSNSEDTSLRKIAQEALAHGMTYGKYVAMLEAKKGKR